MKTFIFLLIIFAALILTFLGSELVQRISVDDEPWEEEWY